MDKPTSPARPTPSITGDGRPTFAHYQKQVASTQLVMMNSGMSKDETFQLAAKCIGRAFVRLEQLSPSELAEIRRFFQEELN